MATETKKPEPKPATDDRIDMLVELLRANGITIPKELEK